MIKLLHISPSYYPAFRFGGPIQSVHLLNKALAVRGVDVDVLTTNAGLNEEQRAEKKRQNLISSKQWVLVDGVRVKYLSFIGYEHYNFSVPFVLELRKIIKNYDIVHITAVWNFPVLAGAVLAILNKKPFIISPRGSIYKETIELKSTSLKKLYFNIFAKKYLNKASSIHFTTEDEKEKVTDYLKLKSPSFVIPNGIDLAEIQKSQSGELIKKFRLGGQIKYFLILGRIDKKKGFDLLLAALSRIFSKEGNLLLVIAGDDTVPYTAEVRGMIEDMKIGDRIVFTGQISGDYKWALYKNAIMFILPSYSENFGMSVVEAMACGCPVVISNKVGISPEVEKNKAGIIVETNIASLEKGVTKLLSDESLRKKISSKGKTMVEECYDINKVTDRMIKKYKQIIENYCA